MAMSSRDNLVAALEGKHPGRIPYSIYDEDFIHADPVWQALLDQGLCRVAWVSTFRRETPNVERVELPDSWRDGPAMRVVLRTPVGEITQLVARGWTQEYVLKNPQDYRVMEYVARDTRLIPDASAFGRAESRVGDQGITLVDAMRSPMQQILVDFAGLETFSFHLAEELPELHALAEALTDQLIEASRIIARGPGRFIDMLENLTAESWGPERFRRHHLPVYARVFDILHAGGKKVVAHFDGKLACLADLVAGTSLDGIESLTSPPEGDMTYDRARAVFREKFIWGNLNVSLYDLPPHALRARVQELARLAAPDGRLFAFEISEDLPRNWKETIPMVLETLERGV
jgi:hypothetical protein